MTSRYPHPYQGPVRTGSFCTLVALRHLAKDAAVVTATNLGDIIRGEPLMQHLTDNRREKSSHQVRKGSIGPRAHPRRKQIGISTDTDVVGADCVHHRLDAFHKFSERVGGVRPHSDDATGVGHHFA